MGAPAGLSVLFVALALFVSIAYADTSKQLKCDVCQFVVHDIMRHLNGRANTVGSTERQLAATEEITNSCVPARIHQVTTLYHHPLNLVKGECEAFTTKAEEVNLQDILVSESNEEAARDKFCKQHGYCDKLWDLPDTPDLRRHRPHYPGMGPDGMPGFPGGLPGMPGFPGRPGFPGYPGADGQPQGGPDSFFPTRRGPDGRPERGRPERRRPTPTNRPDRPDRGGATAENPDVRSRKGNPLPQGIQMDASSKIVMGDEEYVGSNHQEGEGKEGGQNFGPGNYGPGDFGPGGKARGRPDPRFPGGYPGADPNRPGFPGFPGDPRGDPRFPGGDPRYPGGYDPSNPDAEGGPDRFRDRRGPRFDREKERAEREKERAERRKQRMNRL